MTAHSGIFALASLDGAPLAPQNLRALGLPATPGPLVAEARDAAQPQAVHQARNAQGTTLLLGYFDAVEELAKSLKLPPQTPTALLARAALARFGSELPNIACGEWSLLQREPHGALTLMSSAARRDLLFYAQRGSTVAVAPSVHALGRLDWVDRTISEEGFLTGVGNFRLREAFGEQTILSGVRRVPPGGSVRFDGEGARPERARTPDLPPRFTGTIHDGVDQALQLLQCIVAERLGRLPGAAALLSGGLDSALIGWLLADANAQGKRLDFFCSVAPEASGLPDELALARKVADHLDLPVHGVAPDSEASPYRPAVHRFVQGNGPVLGARHYLYDALADGAAALGHTALFDGMFGELTVTGQMPLATPRLRLRQLARRMLGRRDPWLVSDLPQIIRLAPRRFEQLSKSLKAEVSTNSRDEIHPASPQARWPFPPGEIMRTGPPTELLPGRLRVEYPFRDQRLWRLFASFPASFLEHCGLDRAPVRLMLSGRLPEAIRLQPKGIGFSPDYDLRLKRHAPAARQRLAVFRKAQIDEWLDLAWLDATLGRIAVHGPQDVIEAQSAQLTAMAAEFLLWWREGEV
ncbi:MAG TPA: asparagine synthase-related protein [Novosphingobium sp.]|nr:asparagine synthase-related protein [Novosphingobium sp.]